MEIEKVIKLVVKIFRWIGKIKIKTANKIELRPILKRFNIRLWYSTKSQIFFKIQPNVKMQLRSFTTENEWSKVLELKEKWSQRSPEMYVKAQPTVSSGNESLLYRLPSTHKHKGAKILWNSPMYWTGNRI